MRFNVVSIQMAFYHIFSYPTALEMVADGKIDVKSLVTHHFDMSKTVKAFFNILNVIMGRAHGVN
jgi:threonine dehydrogenase-like Zn-dependent dehydrogenase